MTRKTKHGDEMRSHYDFSGGVRGKYATRYAEGTSVIVSAGDVVEVFPDSIAVTEALGPLARMTAKRAKVKARRKSGPMIIEPLGPPKKKV